jgi:hypothetical protein
VGNHRRDAGNGFGDFTDIGADAMTFDMRDAREIAAKCQSRDESIDHDYWNAHAGMFLPTALDEIESQSISLDAAEALIRKNAETINGQAKRIAELEEQDECIECGKHLFQSDPILGKDRVYRLGTIFFDPGSPGGREEPPEPACAIPICQDCLEEDEKVDLLKERISKQHAALKKLGQDKRERGKALVEERAYAIEYNPNRTIEWTHEQAKERAREQFASGRQVMMTEEELKRFRDYASHYQGSDVFFLMKHIDGQADQIATLKAIVRLDRLEYIDPSLPDLGSAEDVVDKQLAQEYPEIFAEENK